MNPEETQVGSMNKGIDGLLYKISVNSSYLLGDSPSP